MAITLNNVLLQKGNIFLIFGLQISQNSKSNAKQHTHFHYSCSVLAWL